MRSRETRMESIRVASHMQVHLQWMLLLFVRCCANWFTILVLHIPHSNPIYPHFTSGETNKAYRLCIFHRSLSCEQLNGEVHMWTGPVSKFLFLDTTPNHLCGSPESCPVEIVYNRMELMMKEIKYSKKLQTFPESQKVQILPDD